MRELKLFGGYISDDTPAWVIAEVGGNHGGSVEACEALFKAAAYAGADAVKLQKRDNTSLFTRAVYDAPYESEHAFGPTYGAHREALEFGWEEYQRVQRCACDLGLIFFATAFDIPSVDFLVKLGVPVLKSASGTLTDINLIRHMAGTGLPLLLSTGGGTLQDVRRAVGAWAARADIHQLAVLQCTAEYPVQPRDMNLRVIETYRDAFPECVVGLSDHHDGISMGPVAYTLGARIFEKHFTLDHNAKGSDHRFSLEPEGLRRFVRDLAVCREALGDGIKTSYEGEAPGLRKMAKSLFATRTLRSGDILHEGDLTEKSPNSGLVPWKADKLYGRQLVVDLESEQPITSSGIVGPARVMAAFDPVSQALANAPTDDEPLTAEERQALDAGWQDIQAGRVSDLDATKWDEGLWWS